MTLVADEPYKLTPVPIEQNSLGRVDLRRADDPITQFSSADDELSVSERHPVPWAAAWGLASFLLVFFGSIAFGVSAAHSALVGVGFGLLIGLGSVRPRTWG